MAPVSRAKTIEDLSLQIDAHMTKINSRFDELEKRLNQAVADNAELKAANTRLHEEMAGLKNHINSLEQYQRNYSVRVNNLQLPVDVAADPNRVKEFVFRKALAPIFQGAIEKGVLAGMPSAHQTLELAHVLPGPQGKPAPIIARFINRNDRTIILQHKKDFAPRDEANKRRFLFPIFEDLTRDNFQLLKRLGSDERTESVWSIRGTIKYKLTGSEVVKKVDNIYAPFESFF